MERENLATSRWSHSTLVKVDVLGLGLGGGGGERGRCATRILVILMILRVFI